MSAVAIEQPSLEQRIVSELWSHAGSSGLKFGELRVRTNVDSATLHKTLCRMWSNDVIRRTPGTRGECRYVLTRIRPDAPGKSQYVAATQRAAHERQTKVMPGLEESATFNPLGEPSGNWYDDTDGFDNIAPTQVIKLRAEVVCLGLAEALVGEADMLMADAQRHVKLAAALTEWATA